ncbi:TetR/AcrR family transcriptional regulator [Nocardioides mangrovicus]|uniref:TetR/AcrR family transcriptional regulator n=1 Tax=Nocardioides mangrovicus TaxID=2478913 RepID=A0A3L8P4P1_9ACTN|nr:TetR/AcrR family transcriptional regulator [Nocardioides mangrovicus]RLV49338.1 TetR/AcrR family transcriptional regulator [Nocardioides mangrovicus]
MSRRSELAEAATDYALEHGLIGLSLRPLAADLGTSDRMLLYHFADKDDLVTTIVRTSTHRSSEALRGLPPSADPERAVLDLWAVVSSPAITRCARLYSEASALGVLGAGPYDALVRESNEVWISAMAGHLAASGVPTRWAARLAWLVDETFMGLSLDLPLEQPGHVVEDLARAVRLLAVDSLP